MLVGGVGGVDLFEGGEESGEVGAPRRLRRGGGVGGRDVVFDFWRAEISICFSKQVGERESIVVGVLGEYTGGPGVGQGVNWEHTIVGCHCEESDVAIWTIWTAKRAE